jgi:AraC-like DNA-binding protein
MLHEKSVGNGLEMLRKVEKIADQLIQIQLDTGRFTRISLQIAKELHVDYYKFNEIFLSAHGINIETLFELRIMEKVKELLVYSEQSLAQIASKLGYKSSAFLAHLLKKKTGCTASHFKQVRKNKLLMIHQHNREQNKQ